MSPFAVTLRELGPMEVKFFSNIPSEDSHNIQTHVVDLNLLVSDFNLLQARSHHCPLTIRPVYLPKIPNCIFGLNQGFFMQFWGGDLGPFRLGKLEW